MSAVAVPLSSPPNRRQRAAVVTTAAVRGGLLAGAIAAIAWIVASGLAATAFFLLLIATVVVVVITLIGRGVSTYLWTGLALAWAVVLLERWIVNGHGGVIVAVAAFVGVVMGARRAGINRWALPLLAYPLISVAVCVAAGQPLDHPWGVSWLWVAAILGPPLGLRVLLDPSPKTPQ